MMHGDVRLAHAAAVALSADDPGSDTPFRTFVVMPSEQVHSSWDQLAECIAHVPKPIKCASFRWRRNVLVVAYWPCQTNANLLGSLIDLGEIAEPSGETGVDVLVRGAGRTAQLSISEWREFLRSFSFPFLTARLTPGADIQVDAKLVVDYERGLDDEVGPIGVVRR